MAVTITRTYEDNPGAGGTNFSLTELSFAELSGVESLWIGLSTNETDLNNLSEGTRVVVTQGSNTVVVTLGAQSFVNAGIAIHPYTIVSGAINFTDGATVTASVGGAAFEISFSGVNLAPGATTTATITADQPVNGLTAADITLSAGATKGMLTGSDGDTTYTLPITLPTGVTGLNTLTLTIAADAVDEGNTEVQASINFGTVEDRIFLLNVNTDIFNAFGFDATAYSTENRDPDISDIDSAFATDEFIYAWDDVGNRVRVWDLFWNPQPDRDITPNSPSNLYRGMTANDEDLILINDSRDVQEFYSLVDGSYDATKDASLPTTGAWIGATRLGDNLFIANNSNDNIYIRTLQGAAVSDFSAGSLPIQTLFATADRVHVVHRTSGNTSAFDATGTAQAADNLALGSGRWDASFVLFAPPVPAEPVVATITIADTKIGGGRSTTATITTDMDVDNFVIGDLSVDYGSLSNFTRVTAREYTVEITAPDDGTTGRITLTLAANSVGGGNNETTATVDFAPLAEPTITFNVTKAISQVVCRATIAFANGVNGLEIGDLSVDVGSLSNFQTVSNTEYTVDITAPAGTGSLTLTLAKDAVDEFNDELTATIDYAPFVAEWTGVPTDTTNGQFSAELHFSHPISGLSGSGIRMVRNSGSDSYSSHNLTNAQVTVTPIASTDNYQLDFDLTRMYDGMYQLQLRSGQVTAGLASLPSASLDSTAFHIDHEYIDADPPDAPTIVQITPSATGAMIEWQAGDDGGTPVTDNEYRLQEGATIDAATQWQSTGSTATELELSNLKKGTQYALEVRQVNLKGEGDASALTTFTTLTTLPAASRDLVTTPAVTSVLLEWRESADNGGSPIINHHVSTNGGAWISTNSTNKFVNITNLQPDTPYTFRVREVNAKGAGAASAPVTTRTLEAPPMPPVWQTGAALEGSVDALESVRINIMGKVSGAMEIELADGLRRWMDWDGAELIITQTPVFRDDTEFEITFLAKNNDGVVPATYTLTVNGSKLATLWNMLLFEYPINYETGRIQRHGTSILVPELSDNDYTTFSNHTDFIIDMSDAAGNPTAFDYIFIKVKGSNITYSISPSGGIGSGFTNRVIPTTVKSSINTDTATEVLDFIHELYPLPSRITATSVRLEITGTNLQIYAVMLLKLGWEIEQIIEPLFEKVDRAGSVKPNLEGGMRRFRVLGAERFKWDSAFTAFFEGTEGDDFMEWVKENKNCAFARQFSRHPDVVYPAAFPVDPIPNNYLDLVKGIGKTIPVRVNEQ